MPGDIPDLRFRLPQSYVAQPELVVDHGPGKDLLIGQNAPRPSVEAVLLGKHAETHHRSVWMDTRGAHVLYVMGKRRSGKTYTLGAIAEGLVSSSWVRQGDTRQAVLILDTMNVLMTMPFPVAETLPDSSPDVAELGKWRIPTEHIPICLFAPAGSVMPKELQSQEITLRASDLGPEEWCGLFEADPFVDPLGHLMTALHAKISSEGYVDAGTGARHAPKHDFTLNDLSNVLQSDQEIAGFPRDTREALRRRLDTVSRYAIFGPGGLDVRQLLKPGTVSVLLLRDLEPEMRAVMVALIVKRVMQLRAAAEQHERMIPVHMGRAERYATKDPERAEAERQLAEEHAANAKDGLPRCWLIIDEAHNYIPPRSSVPSRKPLKKYVDEGRNLGLSILVATQQPSGLDPSIRRNADLLLVHALSHHDDIVAAQGMINTAAPDEITLDGKYRISGARAFERLVRSLPVGYAIASSDRANRLFPLRIRPRATVHGGADY